MILKKNWIPIGLLFISITFASKFCKKYKNHALCIKQTTAKPIISTTNTPTTIDLATNCEIDCNDIEEDTDQVCAISKNGDILVFTNECKMRKYGCENDQNFTEIDERFCDEPTCLKLGSPVCIRLGFRHYVLLENECAVQLYECQFQDKLKIVSREKCDQNLPNCSDGPCVDEFLPICGINREQGYHLFANDCQLRRHNCEFKETYRPTALEYCDEEEENELCDNISCPPIEDPICGKDSKNETEYFANSCILDNYNCKNDDEFRSVPIAECQKDCPITNQIDCDEEEEICASNDMEYKWFNCEDEMMAFNCKKHKNFHTVEMNECHCSLQESTENQSSICATNGVTIATFKKYCDLQSSTKCGLKDLLVPINKIFCEDSADACREERDEECLNIYYPVCAIGKDKRYKWYNSPCSLFASNCRTKNAAVVVANNYCKDPFNVERCHSELCDYRYDPICAEDTTTNQIMWFGNECSIRHYNCFFDENYEAVDTNACGNATTIDANGNL